MEAIDIIVLSGGTASRGEARRVIIQNAVSFDGVKVKENVDTQIPKVVTIGKFDYPIKD